MASLKPKESVSTTEVTKNQGQGQNSDLENNTTPTRGRPQRTTLLTSTRLRRSNSPVCRRRENRLTRISLGIVWLFLFCHIWKLIPTVYELIYSNETDWPVWMYYIKHLSHALIVLNSSLNFLIYAIL
jgi:hypothetical protein